MEMISRHQPTKQTLFFSLEMARNEIWERHLSILAGKDFSDMTHHEQLAAIASGMTKEHKVFDEPRIDIDYIETVCHIESMRKPISVIVVDYIGLVTSKQKHEREDLRIADITQRLTALAMKLKCIVIGLTQTNRDASKRPKEDRCPYPSDVADSVGSVRSSSLWIGIDRPELYDDDFTKKNIFVAKCRKNRRGDNFEAYFDFNGGKFVERDKPFWERQGDVTVKQKFKNRFVVDR
jgi:replicative DNA helicase